MLESLMQDRVRRARRALLVFGILALALASTTWLAR